MSQENVEVVRASMDAFLAVEFERALSYYCEDVVFQPLVGGPYHGRSGVAQQMQTWVDEFNDYWFEVDELIDAEDQVVLLWRDGGVGKSSGVRVEQEAATIYTVDDGCISHARVYADRARAIEAAGLRG
jgi:ketosteroid isomerase-like protein